MTHVNDERQAGYLDGLDAAELWTPETIYDPRPFRWYWRGVMTWDEYKAHKARVEAFRAEYMRRLTEDTERLMAEMGW